MCNCIKRIKKELKETLPEKNESYRDLNITSVECTGEALMLEPKAYSCMAIEFVIHHEPVGRKKKTLVNMAAKFCPFCGKRYIPELSETEQEAGQNASTPVFMSVT